MVEWRPGQQPIDPDAVVQSFRMNVVKREDGKVPLNGLEQGLRQEYAERNEKGREGEGVRGGEDSTNTHTHKHTQRRTQFKQQNHIFPHLVDFRKRGKTKPRIWVIVSEFFFE